VSNIVINMAFCIYSDNRITYEHAYVIILTPVFNSNGHNLHSWVEWGRAMWVTWPRPYTTVLFSLYAGLPLNFLNQAYVR